MFKETGLRSFLKMITFRIGATFITVVLVYIFIGEIKIAISIGILETIIKMIFYYYHERIWDKVVMGKVEEKTIN